MNNWFGVMTSMSFMDVFLSKSPICNIHMKKEKKKQKGGMQMHTNMEIITSGSNIDTLRSISPSKANVVARPLLQS